jgi:sigma-54 dependent transcriptional regulator, acetoin dehydrogenase operon transcriptional activator AcoR
LQSPVSSRIPPPREPYIEAATLRCRDEYQLDPAAPPRSEHVGARALRSRLEELSLLAEVSQPEIRRLFGEFLRPGYVLLMTDETGTILDASADDANLDLVRAAEMLPGFIWDERHRGTNGPGTCLHDGQPRVVHRDDHFFIANRRMTCSAAPIWGPNSKLLGALDASRLDSSDTRASQVATIALVSLSARIIEQLYFTRRFRQCLIMRLHDQPAIGLPQDALLAIDGDGAIAAVDTAALARLGATDPQRLLGISVADLFDISVERLFERAEREPLTPWRLEGGRAGRCHVSLWPARRAAGHGARPAERRLPAEREARALFLRGSGESRRVPLVAPPGCDPRIAENLRRAKRVADRAIHILLQGETGTGKDTFARAIHQASERFDRPFVAVNCGAIPETLIESELFGYAPGAFTGARVGGMRGRVPAADGGTLFLDEIGDMPVAVQARLLRLLEEKEVVPLGGGKRIRVDLKVISATHRDLRTMVASGDFRMDLYYRLNGLTLTLPPLRERVDRRMLIEAIAREEARCAVEIDPAVFALFMAHDWPGNIRELRNTLRTAIAFAGSGKIELGDLPPDWPLLAGRGAVWSRARRGEAGCLGNNDGSECARIQRELDRQHWRMSRTAAALGMSRTTLYRKLRQFGMLPR